MGKKRKQRAAAAADTGALGLRDPSEEIPELNRRIADESPRRGWQPTDGATQRFDALPISGRTLKGLEAGGWAAMKPIQRAAIPHALAGRDVLGAARASVALNYASARVDGRPIASRRYSSARAERDR